MVKKKYPPQSPPSPSGVISWSPVKLNTGFNIEPDHILLINHKYMSSQISHDGLNLETKSWFLSISLTKPKQASKNRNIWWRRGFPDHWQVCHLKNSNTMPYLTILSQAVWFALFVVVTDRHIDHGLTTNSTNLWQITINCIWYWLYHPSNISNKTKNSIVADIVEPDRYN